jgi:hypothetical protein
MPSNIYLWELEDFMQIPENRYISLQYGDTIAQNF